MEIRMRTTALGPGFRAHAGEIVNVPEAMGHDLIAGGYAVQPGAPDDDAPPAGRRRGRRETAEGRRGETTTLV